MFIGVHLWNTSVSAAELDLAIVRATNATDRSIVVAAMTGENCAP